MTRIIPKLLGLYVVVILFAPDIISAEALKSGDIFSSARQAMVQEQIAARGVKDARVLKALFKTPRHLFIPREFWTEAYEDHPLPIGYDQTISQPYIVGLMSELMGLKGGERVLEIGTGSGYQAAVLAELAAQVYTIEIIPGLAEQAARKLKELGYKNVTVRAGDGYRGWPEKAPFDAVMVTAAPDHIPQPLIDQLKIGGRLVIPIGDFFQELLLVTKTSAGLTRKSVIPVRFVPMTGEAKKKKK